MQTLGRLLGGLAPASRLTFAVALHRGPSEDDTLVRFLGGCCPLPVREVDDKEAIEPGCVYVAPAEYHLLVDDGEFSLSTEGPVRFSRPSIDVLFETAADVYGAELVAVLLTGANGDGCLGMHAVKNAGGRTIAQDPATAERPEMPATAIAAGVVDEVLDVEGITHELNHLGGEVSVG